MRAVAFVCLALLAPGCARPPVTPAAPNSPQASASTACHARTATVVPSSPSQVRVVVLNGSDIAGLGQRVGNDLDSHGFIVVKVAADPLRPSEVAVLRYGPSAVGKAALLNAYLRDRGAMQFDIGRVDDTIEMVVGRTYEGLAAPAQRPPRPSPPPGTCA